jgi:hypothetical protein
MNEKTNLSTEEDNDHILQLCYDIDRVMRFNVKDLRLDVRQFKNLNLRHNLLFCCSL